MLCGLAQRWAEVLEHHSDIMPRVQGYLEGMMHSIEQEVKPLLRGKCRGIFHCFALLPTGCREFVD